MTKMGVIRLRAMKLYRNEKGWWVEDGGTYSPLADFSADRWLAAEDPLGHLAHHLGAVKTSQSGLDGVVAPIQSQEVWAAGVTYLRSKAARMEESNFSATAYDRVYEAPRPELFFKATPGRCLGPGGGL